AAGLSVEVAAPQLDWSSSKLSRIENGQQRVDVHGVKSMLDLYDAGGERWTELVELARQCHQKGWWRAFGLDDRGYVPLEAEATSVRDYGLLYVPGLPQTADYAKAVFRAALTPRTEAELDRAVAIRMARQRRLTADDDRLEFVAVLAEAALHQPVGGPEIMRAQLTHLAAATALPSVTLQVVPRRVGAHPGMSAAFTVLGFGDSGMPGMAYVEHPMGSIHVEKESDVTLRSCPQPWS
ncbi:MAG TPA: helix-turn-helix transcriptional regulator, partial [Pseudonocardia sp.]|nr:helix-turn-helix transcriptional regulator [Pseudonocardia sp.]